WNLAADEARHAASFYAFARKHLERSRDPELDRRDGLKIAYAWFHDNSHVRHPVNEHRVRNGSELTATTTVIPRDRIVQTIGTLLGYELNTTADLAERIRRSPGEP